MGQSSSSPKLAEVVTLYPHQDVVAMMRQMADSIESGKGLNGDDLVPVRSATCCIEHEDGAVEVYGWADTGVLRSIGVLHLGIERLTRMRLKQFEDE